MTGRLVPFEISLLAPVHCRCDFCLFPYRRCHHTFMMSLGKLGKRGSTLASFAKTSTQSSLHGFCEVPSLRSHGLQSSWILQVVQLQKL